DRLLDDQLHADRGGEMKDDLALIDELRQQRLVRDRVDDIREPLVGLEMGDVVDRAGRQVVDDGNIMPVLQQAFRQMRADEARASCDQSFHAGCVPFRKTPTSSAIVIASVSASRGWSGSDSSVRDAAAATGQ